ncbi:MAG: CPBP family intramembrane glutamic endopeptidase [Solirubrobacteraceae bacterium]
MLGRRTRGDRVRRDRWVWLSLLPLGLGSWAPMLAGVRRRVWWWIVLGVLWEAVSVTGVVLSSAERRGHNSAAGLLILVGWIAGAITSFSIRRSYDRRDRPPKRRRLPWPKPTERSMQWTMRYALVAYVATFVGANALGLFLRYVINLHVQVGEGVLLVDACLLAGLWPLRRRVGVSRQDLGLRLTRGPRSIGLVVLALITYGAVIALWAVTLEPHSTAKTLSGNQPAPSSLDVVLAVIAISASAPIVEEIFFRGLLYRSIRNRLPVIPAALIAGCLFGLVHITSYPLITLPVKAAFGVIACLLYERTGSLLPGIALHAFVDAGIVDYALTGNDVVVLISSGAIAVLVTLTATVGGVRRRLQPLADDAPAVVADAGEVQAVGGGGWPGG